MSKLDPRVARMVEDRVGLATAIAHKEWSKLSGYDRDDVISWAYQGLCAAGERWLVYCAEHAYEPFEGDAQSWFDTFASRRIRGQIIDQLRASDVATRRERTTIKAIIASGVDLSTSWEHESTATIAAKTGIPEAEIVRAVAALVRAPVSLHESEEVTKLISSNRTDEAAAALSLCRVFTAAVRSLPPLHQRVVALCLYQGLSDSEVALAIPEIVNDPTMARWSLAWVQAVREHAFEVVLGALRLAASPDGSVLPMPVRAAVEAPSRARRRLPRSSPEPIGAVSIEDLMARTA